MDDRELLELAAKAAGIEVIEVKDGHGTVLYLNSSTGCYLPSWNPLTDDGDALRLAVRLGMRLKCYAGDYAEACATGVNPPIAKECSNNDPYAATRRAIVRAAAEIGRMMK